MFMIIRCETCGNDTCDGFSYNLEAIKYGTYKTCKHCNQSKETGHKEYKFWFCSRKCLEEYLKTHEEKDYKNMWEK